MNHSPDTAATPVPARIRARVHDGALQRVTRMFAATLTDIFTESLQNARRAGATRVYVTVDTLAGPAVVHAPDSGDGLLVTVTDDGAGIPDPAVLLSFGETGWDAGLAAGLAEREDAAGMGFLSLAGRGCAVASRPRTPDGHAALAWRVDLAPPHFRGEEDADVRPDDGAPWPHGTTVQFQAAECAAAIRTALEAAARHYPLPVIFDGLPRTELGGEELKRRAFLDGAIHAEHWRGLVFGVFINRHPGFNEPDLNFHGLTLPVRLPTVETVHGHRWTVRADVETCPDLKLVLPARKEAVETEFLGEMRDAARLAIYRAKACDPEPRPAYADWVQARSAGIDLPLPPAVLRRWRPGIADIDDWREPTALAAVGSDALVMGIDPDPPEAQALYRAAARAGIAERLFEADRRLEGFGWYDGLDRVGDVRTEIVIDGVAQPLDVFRAPPEKTGAPAGPAPQRPHTIRMHLAIAPARGPSRTLDLTGDIAFAGEAWSWVGDAEPLVTADSDLEPGDLARLLRASFFSPSDDADADSWETQSMRFEEEALHIATKLLCSDEEARRTSIAEAVRRELFWLIPRDRAVDIAVRGREVTVQLGGTIGASRAMTD